MSLAAGTVVGPYEILASIGAGGMGEVYRARDPRIGREVALKVLPAAASSKDTRQRRFEQEARAAGALNHPNVLAVYDVGRHDGVPYIVSELLTGETLRRRIGGTPLPTRKALDYAVQVARGLAAAHEKDIVHRDLKPDNLFVTKDGRVKILDFGLAKLGPETPLGVAGPAGLPSAMETETGTLPGTLLGTLGYMSPEQVQGLAADARSDIFSFGAVLYEMVTGRRAFKAGTAAETLTAILKTDPLEATSSDVALNPGLERVLRHCLEKSPDERFQSARDLAFALEALSGLSEPGFSRAPVPVRRGRGRWTLALGGALLVALAGVLAGRSLSKTPPPRLSQMTFRAGAISAARFSPDGETMVYSAAWDGGPLEVYTRRPQDQESRPIGLQRARVLSVSRSGELAVQLLAPGSSTAAFAVPEGTLARIPLAGGSPREMLEQTLGADWSPDGSELAVSRWVDDRCRVEYPIGHVLHETENRIAPVRISPRGDLVAFVEELSVTHGRTRVAVVDRAGETRALFEGWGVTGIAWSPRGREVWFDVYEGAARGLRAVSLSGESRLLFQLGGTEATLADVSRAGDPLIVQGHGRWVIFARAPGLERERNLSWHNDSSLVDLSHDGRTLLFTELLFGSGQPYWTSIRRTDGSPAVRLGDGYGWALSPNGEWALALAGDRPNLEFVLWPTGPGEPKRIVKGLPPEFHGATWLPDSRRFVFSGSSPGRPARLYEQDIEGGPPRPLNEEGIDLSFPLAAPDGTTLAALDAYGATVLTSRRGREVRPLPGAEEGEIPIRWSADGRKLYVYRPDSRPVQIFEVDVASGRRRLERELLLPSTARADGNVIVELTPDARSYAYSFRQPLDELYLIQGLD